VLKSETHWSTEVFTVVEGVGQPPYWGEQNIWELVVVVFEAPDDEADGRKTSSTAIPMATKTTTAIASVEIASLFVGLRAECLKLAKVMQPLWNVAGGVILTLAHCGRNLP